MTLRLVPEVSVAASAAVSHYATQVLHCVAPVCYIRRHGDHDQSAGTPKRQRGDYAPRRGGERFTVTRNGIPVADLVPHDRATADRRRRFVPVAEVAAGLRRLPDWDVERFAAELSRLDAAVDDSDAEPWGSTR